MKIGNRLALVGAAGALVLAVPAAAKPVHLVHPSHPAHPGHPAQPSHPAQPTNPPDPGHPSGPNKCAPHNEAYVASGRLVSWSATQTGKGTYTGTITVHVTRSNHHAATSKGSNVTYTVTNTKLRFGKRANPPMAGDWVKVVGEIAVLGKRCAQSGFTPTTTIRKVDIRNAKT